MRFPSAVRRDAAIDAWMHKHSGKMGAIAQRWFDVMRACGDDVRILPLAPFFKLSPKRNG